MSETALGFYSKKKAGGGPGTSLSHSGAPFLLAEVICASSLNSTLNGWYLENVEGWRAQFTLHVSLLR